MRTGTFFVGAVELLKGRRATTHWAYTDLLLLGGAKFEKTRIAQDGNLVTAGGVTTAITKENAVVARAVREWTRGVGAEYFARQDMPLSEARQAHELIGAHSVNDKLALPPWAA